MKYVMLFLATGLLLPTQVFATHGEPHLPGGGGDIGVPEPLSLALVAAGLAGLGVAEMIRRRKQK